MLGVVRQDWHVVIGQDDWRAAPPRYDAAMNRILLSWLGRTDLRAVTEGDQVGIGPIAQALASGRFARLALLCDYPTAEAAPWIILAKTRCPAELIESSIKHGVQTVSIPFQLGADFLPGLLRRPDAELIRVSAGTRRPTAPRLGPIPRHPPRH